MSTSLNSYYNPPYFTIFQFFIEFRLTILIILKKDLVVELINVYTSQ